jgi:hypothetical protein
MSGAETAKGAIHLSVCIGLAVCAAYNAVAATGRTDPRLKIQAVGYTLAALFEAYQVHEHWSGK